MKSKLFIMCGLSGSGKSHIAKELAEKYNATIVATDDIRKELCGEVSNQSKNEEVFKIFHKRIRKYLFEGKNVIADATNITMKSRRAIIENVKKLDVEKICYIVPKQFEDCIRDNANRELPVPKEVIEKQLRNFQVPFKEEEFDEIVIHNICNRKRILPLAFLILMKDFDQNTPYHNTTLLEHCKITYRLFSNKTDVKEGYKKGIWLGSLIHDIGKLYTKNFDKNGIAHYFNHAEIGSYEVLSQLDNDNDEWNNDELLDCCFLINYHMFPFSWNTEQINKKWKRRFGEEKYEMLLKFHECDKARVMEL